MEAPGRILEISAYPPPHAGWAIRVRHVRERILADGHECVVLNIGESRRVPGAEYETVENGWVYVRKIWRHARSGFLVHMHANGESPKGFVLTLVALLLARLARTPSVLTFHAGVDQLYFPREKAPRLAWIFQLMFRMPARVICNSEAVRRLIVDDYGIEPERVVPIPAFSAQYVVFERAPLPEALEHFLGAHEECLFCYLALRPVYHPEVLLEAFDRVSRRRPKVGLVLCGATGHGDPAVAAKVEKLLGAPQLATRVIAVGDLTHDQFLTAMTRCRAYVRTHVSDGVCSSVLEALTLGVPVIASDNRTRPEGVLTYPVDDAPALSELMIEVLEGRHSAGGSAPLQDTVVTETELLTRIARGRYPI